MGETSAKLESLSGEGRQASLAGSYLGFRATGQAPVVTAAMFGFRQGVRGMNSSGFKPTIPVFNGKQESFSR